ncbi:MAG: cytochrome c oxidase assembly protein [Betaproteobacteria bacterium]|nr:cytochrome c oxidase assembly protein [Betaproteobacteria bacterium]MDH5285922.1 cytochrome c oxidase assembly protein [Betaproteobacteria bacterium]
MNAAQRAANRALLKRLGVVVVGMFAFGFALVPFYEKICEVTGIRNIDGPARAMPANTQVDTSRTVRIELDANVRAMAWTFRPSEPVVNVHPGELRQVTYEVVNTTDRPVTGQAIPSYGPRDAGQYFVKLDCFCFATQTLQPGERREMPVVFVVDPSVPRDMPAIALSYTFFEVEGGARVAAAGPAPMEQR